MVLSRLGVVGCIYMCVSLVRTSPSSLKIGYMSSHVIVLLLLLLLICNVLLLPFSCALLRIVIVGRNAVFHTEAPSPHPLVFGEWGCAEAGDVFNHQQIPHHEDCLLQCGALRVAHCGVGTRGADHLDESLLQLGVFVGCPLLLQVVIIIFSAGEVVVVVWNAV